MFCTLSPLGFLPVQLLDMILWFYKVFKEGDFRNVPFFPKYVVIMTLILYLGICDLPANFYLLLEMLPLKLWTLFSLLSGQQCQYFPRSLWDPLHITPNKAFALSSQFWISQDLINTKLRGVCEFPRPFVSRGVPVLRVLLHTYLILHIPNFLLQWLFASIGESFWDMPAWCDHLYFFTVHFTF